MSKTIRTKAEFRELREEVGYTVHAFAYALGVNQRTVRRWERPAEEWVAPDDAWQLLDDALERQTALVGFMVGHARETRGEHPDLAEVRLTYWTADAWTEQYPESPESDHLLVNASTRVAAGILRREGFNVRFEYAEPVGN